MKSFHIIQNIPSPYRLHLFNEMWKQFQQANIEFYVHFMSDMSRGHDERPLSWRNPKIDFPHTYWSDYGFKHHHYNPGMLRHLAKIKPTYLLIGSTFDTFTGFFASQGFKSSVKCAWSEGNTKTTGKMNGVFGWIKRKAFSGCRYIGVPGSDAAKYVALHQSLTAKKMPTPVYLPNLIDETRFKPRELWDGEQLLALRKSLGIEGEDLVAFTPARLTAVKGLVEYFQKLTPEILQGWKLVIFGQGELKDVLLKVATENGFIDNVVIRDFIDYSEMPKLYAMSDMMLLPSNYDPNPLSVVEALHSGLPVALSCMAGNVEEAVTEGRNGWMLPVKDETLYREKLKTIFSADRETLRKMGRVSLTENAKFWNTELAVQAFLEGVGVF